MAGAQGGGAGGDVAVRVGEAGGGAGEGNEEGEKKDGSLTLSLSSFSLSFSWLTVQGSARPGPGTGAAGRRVTGPWTRRRRGRGGRQAGQRAGGGVGSGPYRCCLCVCSFSARRSLCASSHPLSLCGVCLEAGRGLWRGCQLSGREKERAAAPPRVRVNGGVGRCCRHAHTVGDRARPHTPSPGLGRAEPGACSCLRCGV